MSTKAKFAIVCALVILVFVQLACTGSGGGGTDPKPTQTSQEVAAAQAEQRANHEQLFNCTWSGPVCVPNN